MPETKGHKINMFQNAPLKIMQQPICYETLNYIDDSVIYFCQTT